MNSGHPYSPGLVAEMTHWPEVSEKMKEVQTMVGKCRFLHAAKSLNQVLPKEICHIHDISQLWCRQQSSTSDNVLRNQSGLSRLE